MQKSINHPQIKQQKDIRIAIILPVYNTSTYLKECLDSLLNQTHKNYLVFAVDDGSTDNSPAILDEYQEKNVHIKVTHSSNSGVSIARNIALKEIEDDGQFDLVTFCDSDDIVSPDLLSLYAQYKVKYNADFITVGYKSFYKTGIKIKSKNSHTPQFIEGHDILRFGYTDYLRTSPAYSKFTGNICLDAKKIFGLRFDPLLKKGEDQDFRLRALLLCNRSVILSDIAYFYRIRKSSLSHCHQNFFSTPDFSLYYKWLKTSTPIPPEIRKEIEKEALKQWQTTVTLAFEFGVLDKQWPILKSTLQKVESLFNHKIKNNLQHTFFSKGPLAIRIFLSFNLLHKRRLRKRKKRAALAFD